MVTKTPPMGWNTWNTFASNINEDLIIESVDAIIETGLKDVGYEYIVIDDMWLLKERDENGRIVPDPEKFPHGMKYIADYVHSKGLKFGMYSNAGTLTCAGYPGSHNHEWIDAQTFAEWDVDFLKYDFCFSNPVERGETMYQRMGLALANCGRDILYSACSHGLANTRQWIKTIGCGMWRSTEDIMDSWASIKDIAQDQLRFMEYGGQGCFNDMDMLVVGMHGVGYAGVTGCTFEEYKLHFSLWALLNSPLMIGCDIRNMDDETKQILLNKDVIAINQDPGCRQPFFMAYNGSYIPNEARKSNEPFYTSYPVELPVIAKFLDNGDVAIGIFNFTDEEKFASHYGRALDAIGLPETTGKALELTDLWTGEVRKSFNGTIYYRDMSIKPHTCKLYRARIIDK